jgi:hypothetical protein
VEHWHGVRSLLNCVSQLCSRFVVLSIQYIAESRVFIGLFDTNRDKSSSRKRRGLCDYNFPCRNDSDSQSMPAMALPS